MVISKVQFIFTAFAFIFIVTQLGAIAGANIITGLGDFTPPKPPTNPLEFFLYVFQNIVFFFELMTVSSAYTFVGGILVILVVGIVWCVLELIRGV
jgi:hypothetical protein